MIVNIEFHTDNADFEDYYSPSLKLVLQQIKDAMHDSENSIEVIRTIRDISGNRIGSINITHAEKLENL